MHKLLTTLMLIIGLTFSLNIEAKIIKNPWIYGKANTSLLKIKAVELNDTATILHVLLRGGKNSRPRIDGGSYIKVNDTRYRVLEAKGLELDKYYTSPVEGQLIFDAINPDTERIDFSEPTNLSGAFTITGIDLTGKPVVETKIDENTDDQIFSSVKNMHEFEYAYLSPLMIKTLNKGDLSKELSQLPLNRIKSIEMVKSVYGHYNRDFKNLVDRAFSSKKMTTVTHRISDKRSMVRIAVEFTDPDKNDRINKVLFYKTGKDGQNLTLIYIVGDLTADDLLSLVQ